MSKTILLVLLGLPAACASNSQGSSPTTQVVTDTLGLRFAVGCSATGCLLTPQNPDIIAEACSSSGTDAFVLFLDPLLAIYALHSELNAAGPSHPVACQADADCLAPSITIGPLTNSYTCQAGLCLLQQSCYNGSCIPWDGLLLTYDVLTLCQADLPWPTQCPYITSLPYADRIAEVGSFCGSSLTCPKIPADCRQLGAVAAIDGGSIDTGF